MAYKIDYIAQPPTVVATFEDPFDVVGDSTKVGEFLHEKLAEITGDLYYIADMSKATISFSDLVVGMAEAFTKPGSPFAHPRLRPFTVGSSELVRLGTKAAAEQKQYGNSSVKFYDSIDSAMEEIHRAAAS